MTQDIARDMKRDAAAGDNDSFEEGKLARFNHEPRQNPYPENSEQHARWEAGYKFIEQGLVAV